MFARFRKKPEVSRADRDFQILFRIIKQLDKQGLKKLIEAIDSLWNGYDSLRRLKTIDEKETAPVDAIEKEMDQEKETVGEFLDDLEPTK